MMEYNHSTYTTNEHNNNILSIEKADSRTYTIDACGPTVALRSFGEILTDFERTEVLKYPQIYYAGCPKRKHPDLISEAWTDRYKAIKNGRRKTEDKLSIFDDSENYYRIIKHDHIAYRFEILSLLGKGSFGTVVAAHDHKYKRKVALKIIRTEPRFTRQAKEEIKILERLKSIRQQVAPSCDVSKFPLVQLGEHFTFRNHICMTFELLDVNLYDLLKQYKFCGLPRERVRRMGYQILKALAYIEQEGIVHCDLKPENVLLVWPQRLGPTSPDQLNGSNQQPYSFNGKDEVVECHDFIKLIDFGSSCLRGQSMFSYIQSRFYRAPEVILRLGYDTPIDMWSFGCLMAELINGLPLFPGEDESDQLACIMATRRLPPASMLQNSPERKRFFTEFPLNQQRYPVDPQALKQFKSLGVQLEGGSFHLPKYAPLEFSKSNDQLPTLKPGRSRSGKLERGLPGSNSLLQAVTISRVNQFKIKNSSNSQAIEAERLRLRCGADNDVLVDFLKQCLAWLPRHRAKPGSALKHPWFNSVQGKNGMLPNIVPPRSNRSDIVIGYESRNLAIDQLKHVNGNTSSSSSSSRKFVSSRLMPLSQNVLPNAPQLQFNGYSNTNHALSHKSPEQRLSVHQPRIVVIPHNNMSSKRHSTASYSGATHCESTTDRNPYITDWSKTVGNGHGHHQHSDRPIQQRLTATDTRHRPMSEYQKPYRFNGINNHHPPSNQANNNIITSAAATTDARIYKMPSLDQVASISSQYPVVAAPSVSTPRTISIYRDVTGLRRLQGSDSTPHIGGLGKQSASGKHNGQASFAEQDLGHHAFTGLNNNVSSSIGSSSNGLGLSDFNHSSPRFHTNGHNGGDLYENSSYIQAPINIYTNRGLAQSVPEINNTTHIRQLNSSYYRPTAR